VFCFLVFSVDVLLCKPVCFSSCCGFPWDPFPQYPNLPPPMVAPDITAEENTFLSLPSFLELFTHGQSLLAGGRLARREGSPAYLLSKVYGHALGLEGFVLLLPLSGKHVGLSSSRRSDLGRHLILPLPAVEPIFGYVYDVSLYLERAVSFCQVEHSGPPPHGVFCADSTSCL